MDIKEVKQITRKKLKDERSNLTRADVSSMSRAILRNFIKHIDWSQINTVHTYLPIERLNEVDTWLLLRWLWDKHPVVKTFSSVYKDNFSIKHAQINKNTEYETNKNGIPLPIKNFRQQETEYDLIIVPTLGFDSELNRLGYGRGVYDFFLSEQPAAQKIGFAYDIGKQEKIPVELHDMPLAKVVIEGRLYG